jgi:hypothetical protein
MPVPGAWDNNCGIPQALVATSLRLQVGLDAMVRMDGFPASALYLNSERSLSPRPTAEGI